MKRGNQLGKIEMSTQTSGRGILGMMLGLVLSTAACTTSAKLLPPPPERERVYNFSKNYTEGYYSYACEETILNNTKEMCDVRVDLTDKETVKRLKNKGFKIMIPKEN